MEIYSIAILILLLDLIYSLSKQYIYIYALSFVHKIFTFAKLNLKI